MQQGFSLLIIIAGIAVVGLGGAVTYAGLKAFDMQKTSDGVGQTVTDSDDASPQQTPDASKEVAKEGKLASQIGSGFAAKLKSCEESTTEFTHPFAETKLKKTIKGLQGGICTYEEEMPNDGLMTCRLDETSRTEYAEYLAEVAAGDTMSTSTSASIGESSSSSGSTVVDGKQLSFDPNSLFNDGLCTISGY